MFQESRHENFRICTSSTPCISDSFELNPNQASFESTFVINLFIFNYSCYFKCCTCSTIIHISNWKQIARGELQMKSNRIYWLASDRTRNISTLLVIKSSWTKIEISEYFYMKIELIQIYKDLLHLLIFGSKRSIRSANVVSLSVCLSVCLSVRLKLFWRVLRVST